jgi:hypothetical protein
VSSQAQKGQFGDWIKCAFFLWKWAKVVDACDQEISEHCSHGDCQYCLQYLDGLGATDFSTAEMACVRRKNPKAFSDMFSKCQTAIWNDVKRTPDNSR